MDATVIDTSVIVKWFVEEENHDRARGLLSSYGSGDLSLVVPDIALLEMVNALFLGVGLTGRLLVEAIDFVYDLEMEIVEVDRELVERASGYMLEHAIAIYDCVFMALAEREGLPLITADVKHHKREYYDGVIYLEEL